MRALTKYERERVEQLINNWVQSKLGMRISSYASSSVYSEQAEGRTAMYETRYPVIQVDADRVNAVVYGRPATQTLAAIAPMAVEYQEPLVLYYVGEYGQAEIARKLRIAQRTVSDRLDRARFLIWSAHAQPGVLAETRAR